MISLSIEKLSIRVEQADAAGVRRAVEAAVGVISAVITAATGAADAPPPALPCPGAPAELPAPNPDDVERKPAAADYTALQDQAPKDPVYRKPDPAPAPNRPLPKNTTTLVCQEYPDRAFTSQEAAALAGVSRSRIHSGLSTAKSRGQEWAEIGRLHFRRADAAPAPAQEEPGHHELPELTTPAKTARVPLRVEFQGKPGQSFSGPEATAIIGAPNPTSVAAALCNAKRAGREWATLRGHVFRRATPAATPAPAVELKPTPPSSNPQSAIRNPQSVDPHEARPRARSADILPINGARIQASEPKPYTRPTAARQEESDD